MADCITVSNLEYYYDRKGSPALTDLSFSVGTGSIFGLLGPNGAGKTTLIALLTGLIPLQKGSVTITGYDLSRDINNIQSITAVVPQDYAFYPALTARENLKYFASLYGLSGADRHARIAECARICGLTDCLDRKASDYSGGVKRRLNLAIGLLNRPKILYLDEPTVGIDAQSRALILQAIKALQAEGMTIIYTSHYMEEVQSLCDDVAIIDHGRLLLHKHMTSLLDEAERNTLHIALKTPLNETLVKSLQPFEPSDDKKSLVASLNWGDGEAVSLIKKLEDADITVESMQYGVSHFEAVYLSLTAQK